MSLRMLTYYARLVSCSLDSLVGELEPEYAETALDRSLYEAIIKLDTNQKEKLLKTIEICLYLISEFPQISVLSHPQESLVLEKFATFLLVLLYNPLTNRRTSIPPLLQC